MTSDILGQGESMDGERGALDCVRPGFACGLCPTPSSTGAVKSFKSQSAFLAQRTRNVAFRPRSVTEGVAGQASPMRRITIVEGEQ